MDIRNQPGTGGIRPETGGIRPETQTEICQVPIR